MFSAFGFRGVTTSNNDFTDEDDEDDGLVVVDRDRRSYGSNTSSSNGLIELGSHQELRVTYVSRGFFCLRVIIAAIFAVVETMVNEGSYFDEAQFDSKMKELFPSTSLEWSIPDMYKDCFTTITDAQTINAIIVYFGYARADRKTQGRESIATKLVANLITEAGADRVLACDLHSGQSMWNLETVITYGSLHYWIWGPKLHVAQIFPHMALLPILGSGKWDSSP
ncbi:unnamed protein product [Lactuca saligna]|uniref:Ribose-phosphate pyrophosphokinase N-terminal domain-containing protein n=1 Tax=Lactuca saligna TaxID=75948 RepID=A0AA35USG5_LACSI|nr:unnamed protein product [Lactuca saligna]